MREKLLTNSLIIDRLVKLSRNEKQQAVLELLKDRTEQQLADELGMAKSTIHDWKTLRQSCVGKDIHVSLSAIYRKLKDMNKEDVLDWGRLEQIKEECERLLRER